MLRKAIDLVGSPAGVSGHRSAGGSPSPRPASCPASRRRPLATSAPWSTCQPGRVDRRAGRAAYEFLIAAIDLALAGRIDAITTLPLNKESLRLAGIAHPGHTEILAERCEVADHAMMLYLAGRSGTGRNDQRSANRGPAWAWSTSRLHVALRQVFDAAIRSEPSPPRSGWPTGPCGP